jgi:formate dehydrogenase beta subunit
MAITRRLALKGLVTAGAAAVSRPARAAEAPAVAADAAGMLYDAAKCIGCKACMVACNDANAIAPDRTRNSLYHAPLDLNANAKTVIKLYEEGNERSFMKAQCLHCIDPACASACMLGALKKRARGIVSYDPTLCIGCRYCEIACPYNVPKFEWAKAAPKIVKCEMCADRVAAGTQPACTEVCPRQAIIFGDRAALLNEAKRRVAADSRYVQKVYGEHEGGGTQVLYISHVAFDKLGLPALSDVPVAALPRSIQHRVYRGFIAPAALYAMLGLAMVRNRRREAPATGERSAS